MSNDCKDSYHPSADSVLQTMWHDLQDDMRLVEQSYVHGAIALAELTGMLTKEQAELWRFRIKTCPEQGDHGGGRSWCAYCGNVTAAPEQPQGGEVARGE